jgi:ferredoxin
MCSEGGCALGNDQHTAGILADTVSIADHLGVRFDEPLDPERLISRDEPLLAPASTARIAAGLSGTRSAGPPLALAVADVGQVTIDSSVCTACERCAQVCPSQAMSSSRTDDTVVLSFDPQRCTGCSSCLAVCPEADRGAIQVRRELDLTELALGERVIDEVPTATCELCGKPVAPAKMLARIGSILGDDADATMAVIGRRCQQCRGR